MGQRYNVGDIEKGKIIEASEFNYSLGTIVSDGRKIVDRYYYVFINRNGEERFGYYYVFDDGSSLNEDLIKFI